MSTYICKCGRRVQKSSNADNTRNRLKGYGPGHECYGCPYVLSWGTYEWNEETKNLEQKTKGYECHMSKTLSYASQFIGSTKDKCTCSVVSLDFDFLEEISAWIKETFTAGELTGGFSRGEIRATEYCHNGRYQYALFCAQNKKGIAAKAALFEHFFNPDGSRKDMTPQQEMEKVLADIKKAKEESECETAQNADAAVTTAENAVPTATAATLTTSESAAAASASTPATSLQNCESGPAVLAESFSAGEAVGGTSSPILTNPANAKTPPASDVPQDKPLTFLREDKCPEFDYSGLPEQAVENLHFAEDEYRHGKQMAERGLVHMGNAVAAAHDELCTVVAQCDNGRFAKKEDTFRAWCLSIGITKDSAYRLLQVSALMAGSSPRQRAILEALPPTLLYAVAKPSAPAELVEKVKNGEVSTNKEYQDLLAQIKAEKERADAAEAERDKLLGAQNRAAWAESHIQDVEAQRDAALADVQGLTEQNAKLQQSYHDADESRIAANLQRQKAEAERDRAEARAKDAENQLAGSRQVAEAAKLRGDKLKAENDALKSQPITAVVDEEEVDRRAGEKAYQMAAEMTAELRAQLEQASSGTEQDAHSSYDNVLLADRSFQNIGKMVVPSLRRLPPEQREQLTNMLVHTLGQIQGEVSRCL